jgi:hypothetical protein
MTLSSMLDVTFSKPAANSQQEVGGVLGLRVLLDEVLPVLTHTASYLYHHTSCGKRTKETSGQPAPLQDSTAQPAGAPDALTESHSSTSSSQISNPCTSSCAAPKVPPMPVESIILLLGPSAQLLHHSISLAVGNKDAYSTLSGSLHPANSTCNFPQDDLVAALDAVLTLATHLISDGPWWQQAKAHHPVLLRH